MAGVDGGRWPSSSSSKVALLDDRAPELDTGGCRCFVVPCEATLKENGCKGGCFDCEGIAEFPVMLT